MAYHVDHVEGRSGPEKPDGHVAGEVVVAHDEEKQEVRENDAGEA